MPILAYGNMKVNQIELISRAIPTTFLKFDYY